MKVSGGLGLDFDRDEPIESVFLGNLVESLRYGGEEIYAALFRGGE